jgi:hypothetical protein
MAFPTFSPGDILNASDMNAVGLWLIKTVTPGTTVSSVPVTDVFSADFDAYRVVMSGGAGATGGNLNLTLGASTTGYYTVGMNMSWGATTVTGFQSSNAASLAGFGNFSTSSISAVADIVNPFLAKRTQFVTHNMKAATGLDVLFMLGFHDVETSYTGFTITTSTGTITGGTIRVYGYRN